MLEALAHRLRGWIHRAATARGRACSPYDLQGMLVAAIYRYRSLDEPEAEQLLSALISGDMHAAARVARQMLLQRPADLARIRLAGVIALAAEQYETAADLLARAADDLETLRLLAACHVKLGRLEDAARCRDQLRAAGGLDGFTRVSVGLLEGSIRAAPYARTPGDRLLRRGLLREGFERVRSEAAQLPAGTAPEWDGSRVDRLVLKNTLGDGDALMFLRFAHQAAQRVGELVLVVQPRLVPLYRRAGFNAAGVYALLEVTDEVQADAQLEVMALPAVLGAQYGEAAYLRVDRARHFGPGLHVGVNWAASPLSGRSAHHRDLEPLAAVAGATFHCLVHGGAASNRPSWVQPLAVGDYLDTARIVAGLDLIITVDTSLAHLAGSIGRPVWLALPGKKADWRWGVGGQTTPWYPKARLFRGPGAWREIAAELSRLARSSAP